MAVSILITKTSEEFNHTAASVLCDAVRRYQYGKTPNITLARGDTHAGIYEHIVHTPSQRDTLKLARFFQLSEVGFSPETIQNYKAQGRAPKSLRSFIEDRLLDELDLPDDRVCYFPPRTQEEDNEYRKHAVQTYRTQLEQHHTLNIAFLGIGAKNDDHIAQIPPETAFSQGVYSPDLSDGMRRSYLSSCGLHPDTDMSLAPDFGFSIGPANLPQRVIVAASGAHKAQSVHNMICAPISSAIPTTLVRRKRTTLILDQKAASILMQHREDIPKDVTFERPPSLTA